MCRLAKKLMEERGACLVVTGEVLGQRPMSQQRAQLNLVEKHSGLKGRLLRPLSAKLLSPTIPELEGLVDRDKLYQFTGRGRKPLIELAHQLGVREIPQPSIGCLLTQPSFAPRVFDLLRIRPGAKLWEFDLLRVGRHLPLGGSSRVDLQACKLGTGRRFTTS
jgi:Thiamine biosynthesis ATP pyrophosphatase